MTLYDPGLNSDFFIKTKNELKRVSNGYIRRSCGGKRKIDFCYRNSEGKFIFIDFDDALVFLKSLKRRTKRESTAFKLTSNTVYKDRLITHHQTCIEKTYNEVNNHSSDIFSESNLEDYFVPSYPKINPSKVENKHRSHSVSLPSESSDSSVCDESVFLNYMKMHPNESLQKDTKQTNSTKMIDVDGSTMKIIKNWLCRNPRHNLLKDNRVLPSNFTSNIKYLRDVLFALNPLISIRRLNLLAKTTVHDNHISKEDFANTLGLLQITAGNGANTSNKTNLYHSSPVVKNRTSDPNHDSSNLKLLFSPQRNDLRLSKIDQPNEHKSDSYTNKIVKNNSTSSKKYPLNKSLYTPSEDRIIINWVLKGNNMLKVNGNTIWKELESKDLMPKVRSWQSLRSRFVKTILFKLRDYALSQEDEMKLKIGAQRGLLNTKKKFNNNYGLDTSNKAS